MCVFDGWKIDCTCEQEEDARKNIATHTALPTSLSSRSGSRVGGVTPLPCLCLCVLPTPFTPSEPVIDPQHAQSYTQHTNSTTHTALASSPERSRMLHTRTEHGGAAEREGRTSSLVECSSWSGLPAKAPPLLPSAIVQQVSARIFVAASFRFQLPCTHHDSVLHH
jgi:hypothetical protein